MLDRHVGAGELEHELGQLGDRRLHSRGEVEHVVGEALLERRDDAVADVLDVEEVARRASVPVDRGAARPASARAMNDVAAPRLWAESGP